MTVIKCKMCGGDMELSTDKTFGSCEYCGSVMTLPKVDGEQTAAAARRAGFKRIITAQRATLESLIDTLEEI